MSDVVTAFAPASIGNVGVGFDMLGLALSGGAGDTVIARRSDTQGISIEEVRGLDGEIHPYLSADPLENTASIAAQALWNAAGATGGASLKVHKGVPLQSGMGSSAASAVAAVVAVNALLDDPLEFAELLPYALEGEKYASGGLHADNVAPSCARPYSCPTSCACQSRRASVPCWCIRNCRSIQHTRGAAWQKGIRWSSGSSSRGTSPVS
jgi:homoserine kinase